MTDELDPTTPLPAAAGLFLAGITTARTQSTYRSGVAAFTEFLRTRHKRAPELAHVAGDTLLVDFRRWLNRRKPAGQWSKDGKLSAQTVRNYIAGAVAFITWLFNRRVLDDSFSLERARSLLKEEQKRSRTPYPLRTPADRLPAVVEFYDNLTARDRWQRLEILRNRAILHTFYSTLARLSEVASLNRGDVANGRATKAVVVGKGEKPRTIFFTPEARAAITAYLREREDELEPLFLSRRKARLSDSSLFKIVKVAARACGVRAHPHMFRHYRARQMLREGMPLSTLQQLLGHADIATTRRIYAPYIDTVVAEDAFETYGLSPADALKQAERGS